MIPLNLTKNAETLTLNLSKVGIVDLPTMEVRLAIDKSGSMYSLFSDGTVDRTVDLFLAAGLKFDDNQTLDVGFFDGSWHDAPTAVASDAGKYLKKARETAGGGTCYAPIIENFETKQVAAAPAKSSGGFMSKLLSPFSKPEKEADKTSTYRAYCGIITDGDGADHRAFEQALARTSGDTYFQFITIGSGVDPRYLQSVSSKYAHVDVFHVDDISHIDVDEFYAQMCSTKLADWIKR